MSTIARHGFRSSLQQLAAMVALLASANLTFAQATPPAPAPYPAQPQQPQQPQQPPPGYAQPAQPGYPPQQPPSYPAQQPPPGSYPAAPPAGAYPNPPPPGYGPQPAPLYQPSAPSSQSWRPPVRPSRALLITGASLLGGFYLVSTTVGLAFIENADSGYDYESCGGDCRKAGRFMFLPVAGPFAAMGYSDADPALWLLGMAQLASAALTIGGVVRFRNTKRAAELNRFAHWELPGERSLSLNVATSARFSGPRLRLDF